MFELITIACIWAFSFIGSGSQIKTDREAAKAGVVVEQQATRREFQTMPIKPVPGEFWEGIQK